MKDIDFDELDRAVSSLIANNPTTNVGNDVLVSKPTFSKTPINSHFSNSVKLSSQQPISVVSSPLLPVEPPAAPVVSAAQNVVVEPASMQTTSQAVFPLLSTDFVEVKTPVSNQVAVSSPETVASTVLPRPTTTPLSTPVRLVPKNVEPIVTDVLMPTPTPVAMPIATSVPAAIPTPMPTPTPVPVSVNSVPITKPLPTIPIPVKPTQPISPLVSRRSSGRFMDVVPPSTDMRTVLSAPDRVSRLGSDVDMYEPVSQVAVLQEPEVESIPEPQIAPVVAQEPVKSDWSDLVEFDDVADLKKTSVSNYIEPAVVVEEDEDDDIDRINADIDKTLGQIPDVQESPFLSGAKVEKRPLNAFMAESLSAVPSGVVEEVSFTPSKVEVIVEGTTGNGQNSNNNPDPADIDAPLPAELQGDLLSIESGNVPSESEVVLAAAAMPIQTIEPAQAVVSTQQTPAQAPVQVSTSVAIPQSQAVVAPSVGMPKANPVADGPTSISQQYQEKPSTGDQSTGAIFDTASYHKTVVKPAKKNTNLFWIVWILLLLVIGVGVGAAIYFFVVPLL